MLGWMKNMLVSFALQVMGTEVFRERLVEEVNERVDVPKLTEEEEEVWFDGNATALQTAFVRAVQDL